MKKVFMLWRYEKPKRLGVYTGPPVVWSVHKTMAGAEKEMKKYKTDGFICEIPLRD